MLDITLPQFEKYKVRIALYRDVTNAAEIRAKVAQLPYAFIDAATICSVEQLMSALYRLMVEATYNKLRTRSVHSELLLCLSPTSNIGEALGSFGIKDSSKSLLVVKICGDGEEATIGENMVSGREVELSDTALAELYDEGLVRKVYRIDPDSQLTSVADLSRAVVNAIQLRGL